MSGASGPVRRLSQLMMPSIETSALQELQGPQSPAAPWQAKREGGQGPGRGAAPGCGGLVLQDPLSLVWTTALRDGRDGPFPQPLCPSPPWGGTRTHPGMPPASILLATVTSVDHTSYCQRFRPRTPPSTVPVCTPTRMSTPVFVFSRTYLPGAHTKEGGLSLHPARWPTPPQSLPAAHV